MILNHIQQSLELLYQLDCEHSVNDFLLGPEQELTFTKDSTWVNQSDEVLFVEQEQDNLNIGLYLNPNLLNKYKNTSLFCTSIHQVSELAPLMEGVSHFLYLMYHTSHEHSVTQLELELQSEIDKFVLGNILWKKESLFPLMEHYFGNVKWNGQLSEEQMLRYLDANKYASKFCNQLVNLFNRKWSFQELYSKIRPFYRMNQADKMRFIHSL